jgi:Protein of unknown function (DUF3102)
MLTSVTATHTHSTMEHFDYSDLDTAVAEEAKAVVARVRARTQAAVIDTGRDFIRMKDRLGHGQFIKWLRAEFSTTARTAQRYMSAAAAFHDKCELVSYLPPSELYALAAPSTPAHVREGLLARLEAGERPSPKLVREMVTRARKDGQQEPDLKNSSPRSVDQVCTPPRQRPVEPDQSDQHVAAGQPHTDHHEVIVVQDDVRAAAELIVLGLGERVSNLLQVLGEHSSITRQNLVEAAMRLLRARRAPERVSSTPVTTTDGSDIPADLDRRINL